MTAGSVGVVGVTCTGVAGTGGVTTGDVIVVGWLIGGVTESVGIDLGLDVEDETAFGTTSPVSSNVLTGELSLVMLLLGKLG